MTSGDLLLHAASARREMPWNIFKSVCDTFLVQERISGVNGAVERSAILRTLDSLGHLEVAETPEGRRIVIGPSALARLPTEHPAAVFTGSRSLEAIERLQTMAKRHDVTITIGSQPGRLSPIVPQRIAAHAATEESLAEYARSLGVAYQNHVSAWAIGQLAGGLQDALEVLRWETSAELNWRWIDFNPERACFDPRASLRSEYRLTKYLDPTTTVPRYRLWDGSAWAESDAEWGRYAALRKSGLSVCYFDRSSNLFGVPWSVPMPRLLARAVALCSGYAPCTPRRAPGDPARLDVYRFVPKAVADLVALKLGQDLSNCRIEV